MTEKGLTIFPVQGNSGLTSHILLIFSEFFPDASLRFVAAYFLVTPYSTEYQITNLETRRLLTAPPPPPDIIILFIILYIFATVDNFNKK